MNGRDRFLTALANEKPDRLPCQVHNWMGYYLNRYLGGADVFTAYEMFDMDPVIYVGPIYHFDESDLANGRHEHQNLGQDADGITHMVDTWTTPGGVLTQKSASNEFTAWVTKRIIETKQDFEIWSKYMPVPIGCDWSPVIEAKKRIGNRGIVRSVLYDFGQCSPWQSFCILFETESAIMAAMDDPQWVHHVLSDLLDKKLRAIERMGKSELDLVEVGGGAGSNTVISPKMFREFCLPYDQKQIRATQEGGPKVVYHLCGGLMKMLDLVVETGANGLETMTPPEMGGDCNLSEATKKVGDKLFFIGGFDQNRGFEKGTPETARQLVRECHEACPDGGYICSPSDHFFFGDPENVRAFSEEARGCEYS